MNALRSSLPGGGLNVDWLGRHDMDVLHTLSLVRTAASDQLGRLHFPDASARACQRCLARLSRERLVTRLSRRVGGISPGSSPWAYSLGTAGQRLLGLSGPKGGRVRRPWVPNPLFLRHTLLITEVYVCAVEVSRAHDLALEHFATEPECWRYLDDGSRLRPDAEICLGGTGYEDHYLIEADRGTEGPGAMRRKLDLYRRHFQSGKEQEAKGVFPRVLFVTLDDRRRAQLASQLNRQREDVRPIFAVTQLSGLPGLLAWGSET